MPSSSCSYLLYRDPVPASFRAHFSIYQDAYIVNDLFYESSPIYQEVNTMTNFIVQFPLKTEKYQEDILDKRFEIGRQIYNSLVNVVRDR